MYLAVKFAFFDTLTSVDALFILFMEVFMENTKKQGFCIGTIFLILQVISDLFIGFRGSSIAFLQMAVLIAICVFLFMKKQNIILAILAMVNALLSLTYLSSYVTIFKNLSTLLAVCAWALIGLIILVNCEILPNLANKLSLLGKIFYPVVIIWTVIDVLLFLINGSSQILVYKIFDLLGMHLGRENIFLPIFSAIFVLLLDIGVILVGKWVLPAQVKEKNGASDDRASFGNSSEFYVSMGKHICLMLFTCGVWLMIWVHKVTKFCNNAKGEEKKSPTKSLLMYLFIPFYSLYWTYKMAQRIDKIAKEKGVASDIGTVCLILAIFVGFVPPILMQDKINGILTTDKIPVSSSNDEIDSLEKYKELLDKGVITQEEFDAKKKQLLGL